MAILVLEDGEFIVESGWARAVVHFEPTVHTGRAVSQRRLEAQCQSPPLPGSRKTRPRRSPTALIPPTAPRPGHQLGGYAGLRLNLCTWRPLTRALARSSTGWSGPSLELNAAREALQNLELAGCERPEQRRHGTHAAPRELPQRPPTDPAFSCAPPGGCKSIHNSPCFRCARRRKTGRLESL